MLGKQLIQAAAGAAGAGGAGLYVDDVFSTFLYPGSFSAQTITNGIDLSTEGGLVWMKSRTNTNNHALLDSERSWSGWLQSNTNNGSQGGGTYISANTDGFTFNIGNLFFNGDPQDYTSWTFRKAPGFFDVVTYAGNSTAGRTVAHNLGSVPGMIIIKAFSGTVPAQQWFVYHRSTGATKYLRLDTVNAATTQSSVWNDTEPTSSVFSLGGANSTNGTGINYVAYIFAHDDASFGTDSDESIIKCGSYSSTGFVDLGWEPQWVMIKSTSVTSGYVGDWRIFDNMRGIVDGNGDAQLFANETRVEDTTSFATALALNATGFTVEGQGNYGTSTIYMAIRRPHKPPTAGTDVFLPAAVAGNSDITTGFPVDLAFQLRRTSGSKAVVTRLTGKNSLETRNTNAETTNANAWYESNTQLLNTGLFTADSAFHLFKRAPGFLDVVAYSAASGDLTVPHSLGVTPEMIIIKSRNHTSSWKVWHSGLSAGTASTNYNCNLDDDAAEVGPNANIVSYSNTNFIVGNGRTATNKSSVNGTYIAYLFATLPDISKVGSYTGTGNAINVDCGFSSGARFILIKRSDSTGDWFVYDSARGIVSGDDPYLLLNSNAAEVTNTDYIDPLSSGFTVTSSAPTGLNASGGTYIFLAIA